MFTIIATYSATSEEREHFGNVPSIIWIKMFAAFVTAHDFNFDMK